MPMLRAVVRRGEYHYSSFKCIVVNVAADTFDGQVFGSCFVLFPYEDSSHVESRILMVSFDGCADYGRTQMKRYVI